MNTLKSVAVAAGYNSQVTCINCGSDFNTNDSPECPCCGLHHRAMTCQSCGENFFPPEESYYNHDQQCPHCSGWSFRPFYFEEITDYPLTEGSFHTQYPQTDYPESSEETTDYPFELDTYPLILCTTQATSTPAESIITSSRKEYLFDIASLSHDGNSPFLRLRGMSLFCNTSRFPEGAKLRMLLRDRKSCQFIEKDITVGRKEKEECVFDFGVEVRYFTMDIAVSFKLIKEERELAWDIPGVRGEDFPAVRWTDKAGSSFTPVLKLYGYTVDPDTAEQGMFHAGYPTTAYPTTEYPDSSSSSSQYADWEYPAGGAPAIVPMTFMYEADFWHHESVRGQVERRTLPSLSLPLSHIVIPEDRVLDVRLVDIGMALEVLGNRSLELWVDGKLWKNVRHWQSNPVLMRMDVEASYPNWEDRLAKVPTIEIKAADGKNLDFFFDKISGKPIAAISGTICGLPTPAYPTTEYPTTEYPKTPYPTCFPTTGYSSSEYSQDLASGLRSSHAMKAAVYPAVYGYESLSDSSSSYPGSGDVSPRQGPNDSPENKKEPYFCPTTLFPEPGNTETEEGSAGTEESFGGDDDSGLPSGNISMISPRLGIEMASPSVLKYRHISQRRIGGFNSPTGLIQDATQVCVYTERGFPRFTDFSRNSEGERTDRSLTKPEQLRKITIETDDGSGLPVQSSCFEEILGDGTLLRYSLETGEVLAMKAYKGVWITAEKWKENLHIVYENVTGSSSPALSTGMVNNIYLSTPDRPERIRQIWSSRDGLMDIVVLGSTSYDIRWYASEDVGSYNESQKLYTIHSGASPVKVWKVEATLINYQVRSDGKKYEVESGRLLTEEDLKYLRKLRVTEQRGNLNFVTEWEQPDSTTLIFTRGTGTDAETTVTRRTATNPATYAELLAENPTLDSTFLKVGETLTREVEETRTVPGLSGGSKTRTRRYPFGDVMVYREEGTGTANPSTVTYEYDTDTDSRTYGCCIKETYSNGKVVTKNYDAQKRLISIKEPWAGGSSKISRYTYDNRQERQQQLTSVTESLMVAGREKAIARTSYAYSITPEIHEEKVTRIGLGSPGINGIPQPEVSLTQWYGADSETNGQECVHAAGRMKMRRDATGKQYDYLYVDGAYEGISYVCFVTQTFKGDLVQHLSTSVAHYYDNLGREVRKCEYVQTGETFTLVSDEKYTFDSAHRIVRTDMANGKHTESTWICRGPLQQTDENGVQTRYEYNSAKKLVRETRDATPYVYKVGAPVSAFSLPGQVTEYRYDAAGREIERKVATGDRVVTTCTEWDALGRVKSQTGEGGRTTRYEYSADGLQTTAITPTGSTLITRNHTDGNVLSETGTGRQACYYSYSCNNWELETRIRLNTLDGPLVKELFTGGKGQSIYTREARGGRILVQHLSRYDLSGRLVASQDENRPETLKEYDELGNIIRETVCRMAPRRNLVTETKKSYLLKSLTLDGMNSPRPEWEGQELVWLCTVRSSYVAGEQHNAVTETRWELVSQHLPDTQEALVFTDKYGRQMSLWKETVAGNEYRYTFFAGGTGRDCSMSLDGRTVWEQSAAGERKTYSYQYLPTGERVSATDGRGNTVVRETDLDGHLISVSDGGGNTTVFEYNTGTGQLMRQTDAMGGTIEYQYDARGRLLAQYGTAAQPLRFEYDEADRMTALYTWRVPEGTLTTSPLNRTDGDVTRWVYEPASGVLLEKQMADGSRISYDYDSRGLLRSINQPTGNVYYRYDVQMDQLMKIRYSDGTPGVTFTRDDWGNILTVSDAGGTREYRYDHLRDQREETLTMPYDTRFCTFRDNWGREGGHWLFVNGQSCQKVNLAYGNDLRLSEVRLNDDSVYTYGWHANTGLPATITAPNGLVREWTYEEHRNNVTQIHYKAPDGGTLVSRENTFDEMGRLTYRQDAKNSNQRHGYTYNGRSEVTGDTLEGSGRWTYSYDNLGNRITSGGIPGTSSYTTNMVNQYTAITGQGNAGTKTFRPCYDSSGNQTLIETDTGEWTVEWNAENRPVVFTRGNERVECLYDFMGRRTRKIHISGGDVISHCCYVYNGYKLVAELDARKSVVQPEVVKTWLWDPSRNEDATPLEVDDWRGEEEYPDTEYPETDYPTTEYATTEYPTDISYFSSADLLMRGDEICEYYTTTYDDSLSFSINIRAGIFACVDRIELVVPAEYEEYADSTICDYKATVILRNRVTVYAELEGNILKLDLTGQVDSWDRIVPVSREIGIRFQKREKNNPAGAWQSFQHIAFYSEVKSSDPMVHVSGCLMESLPPPPSVYPSTDYPVESLGSFFAETEKDLVYRDRTESSFTKNVQGFMRFFTDGPIYPECPLVIDTIELAIDPKQMDMKNFRPVCIVGLDKTLMVPVTITGNVLRLDLVEAGYFPDERQLTGRFELDFDTNSDMSGNYEKNAAVCVWWRKYDEVPLLHVTGVQIGEPTTEYPTTEYPTTEYPTTEYPTTEYPTTEYPTTEYPTTEYPTTEYPTTEYPTTEYPTTEYPTTEYPTTEYPTTEYPTTEYPLFDFDRPSLLPGNILYLQKGMRGEAEERWVESVSMPLGYQDLPGGCMFVVESVNCASDCHYVQSGNASITLGDGLYQVTTYADWVESDVICADMEKAGVHEELRTVTTSFVEFRMRDMTSFPAWFDRETGRPVGLITGRIMEWATTAYPTTDYPVTTYATTEFLSETYNNELSMGGINNQQTKTNMKTNTTTGTAESVPEIRTRNKARSLLLMTGYPQLDPPYPTFYAETEYLGSQLTHFPEETFFPSQPDTLWIRSGNEGKSWSLGIETEEVVITMDDPAFPGGDLVLDAVEILLERESSDLPEGTLTSEIHIDGKRAELVQMTTPDGRIYRIDLKQAGISENARTLKEKREFMIKVKKGTSGYSRLTVWGDSRKRPYVHVMGRILPQTLPKPKGRYYCLTDHNKNVTGLVDDTRTIRATWDYDAFGNCISRSGDMSEWNPVRYSSEYYDRELGLIYYNYRHYNPRDGRWISRDLIGEKGGFNLYNNLNNIVNLIDILGAAVFVVVSDPACEIFSNFVNDFKYYKKILKKFRDEVANLNDKEFLDAVEDKKVMFNGDVVDWSKDEYVKRIDHELSSSVENVISGGWQAVESRVKYFAGKTKYKYDELYFMCHGNEDKRTFIYPYVYSIRKINSFFDDATSNAKGKKQVIACHYTFPGNVYTRIIFYTPSVTRKMLFFCVESVSCYSFEMSIYGK